MNASCTYFTVKADNEMKKKNSVSKIIIAAVCVLVVCLVAFLAVELATELSQSKTGKEVTVEQMQAVIDKDFAELPATIAYGTKEIYKNMTVSVNSVEYGIERDVILNCSYSTLNVAEVLSNEKINSILCEVYDFYLEQKGSVNATAIQIEFEEKVIDVIKSAKKIEGETQIRVYQMDDGSFHTYFSDEVLNTVFGGLLSVQEAVEGTRSIIRDGNEISIENLNTLRTGIINIIDFKNYDTEKPNTSGWLLSWISDFTSEFKRNFVDDDIWKYIWHGLITTLELTGCSLFLGIILGLFIATVRVTHDKTGSLPILNAISKAYLSVIRGTPIMVQLLIIYFVILAPLDVNKFLSAVICFGINSGAYVAEIIRGGIESVDGGQNEAGRSLGLNYIQTMIYVIIPQAFKTVLPSLANEFITLLKETSVAFYIGVADLTQAGIRIRSITFSNFMPLVAIALVYLALVLILTKLVGILEKELKKSER